MSMAPETVSVPRAGPDMWQGLCHLSALGPHPQKAVTLVQPPGSTPWGPQETTAYRGGDMEDEGR